MKLQRLPSHPLDTNRIHRHYTHRVSWPDFRRYMLTIPGYEQIRTVGYRVWGARIEDEDEFRGFRVEPLEMPK